MQSRPEPGTEQAVRQAAKRVQRAARDLTRELAAWEERRQVEALGIGYHPVRREDEEDLGDG
jgi:hypothetical protein